MPSRRMWIIAGTVVGVVAVGAVAGPLVYAALQEDAPPATTVQAQDSDAPLTDVTDGTWTIGAGSSAGYRVDEVLNGDDVTVAGTTDQVTGSLVVSGGDLQSAEVDVDMASVATDSGRRDSYFRDNVIDVAANPTATFAVTQAVDLPELTGTPVTVPVAGELSVHGVTQQVTVDLSVVRTAQGVEASGSIPVTFADYDVTPPDLGFVSVEDTGSVEFFLVLTQ
ncbi:YceI family protein [Klenkia terrae]|jgi:polyisoprenoid-binding protein YceI|uniref:YceI family protein n=1 Tax=Klenkia terrae TaxID=1052259 RepID=A0ABU8EEB2_9ACTN|nr:YceI family protein [Klenkia terrae]SSC24229.1 Lipid/polyisoprenoid-binding, YceI-like [Klenkia terrae]